MRKKTLCIQYFYLYISEEGKIQWMLLGYVVIHSWLITEEPSRVWYICAHLQLKWDRGATSACLLAWSVDTGTTVMMAMVFFPAFICFEAFMLLMIDWCSHFQLDQKVWEIVEALLSSYRYVLKKAPFILQEIPLKIPCTEVLKINGEYNIAYKHFGYILELSALFLFGSIKWQLY